jgi:hypothetical protein
MERIQKFDEMEKMYSPSALFSAGCKFVLCTRF